MNNDIKLAESTAEWLAVTFNDLDNKLSDLLSTDLLAKKINQKEREALLNKVAFEVKNCKRLITEILNQPE